MSRTHTIEVFVGVAITVAVGMASFAMKWQFDANAKLAVIEEKVSELAERDDADTMRRHWRILGQHREAINELRRAAGLPSIVWGD